jgi:PP-loop superfamily ATP-utilizing enzyme
MLTPEILPSAGNRLHPDDLANTHHPCNVCTRKISQVLMKKKKTKNGRRALEDIEAFLKEVETWDDLNERKLTEEEMSVTSSLLERSIWDRELCRAIAAARATGTTWERIGNLLGITPQAAHKKYAPLMKDAG